MAAAHLKREESKLIKLFELYKFLGILPVRIERQNSEFDSVTIMNWAVAQKRIPLFF